MIKRIKKVLIQILKNRLTSPVIDKILYRRYKIKEKKAYVYLNKCIEQYFNGELEIIEVKAKKEFIDEKIIWQYWGQGVSDYEKLPFLTQLSFKSVDKFKGDFRVIRLDDGSVSDYLEFPSFVKEKLVKGIFTRTFFSDLLRVALLKNYGGVWLDATMVLTGSLDKKYFDGDYFVFQRDSKTLDKERWIKYNKGYFNWDDDCKVSMLSSFFVAKKKNEILDIILSILLYYWKTNNKLRHYFVLQILYHSLLNEFMKEHKCKIIDDTFPHSLLLELEQPFDKKKYEEITKITNVHMFRHYVKFMSGTFYEHVFKLINNKE